MKHYLELVPKPRMTVSDRWKKRPAVMRYWEYKDKVRKLGIEYKVGHDIIYTLAMPKSWSKKKKEEMNGKPHEQKPDIDNLQKALFDAIFDEDKHIHLVGKQRKIWGYESSIEIGYNLFHYFPNMIISDCLSNTNFTISSGV